MTLISLAAAGSFLLTSIGSAWAEEIPSKAGKAGVPQAAVKALNVGTFSLPEDLGQIKDAWQSSSGRTIVHIQDAHCNYEAQHKIAEIIEYLNKNYGINVVDLEGGAGSYDLSVFTGISDKPEREKASDHFVKEGMVSGAEYAAINNPEKLSLWGVEDADLYLDNLYIYRDSLQYSSRVKSSLGSITYILDNLKAKIYSKELLELDRKYSAYKAEETDLKEYITYLIDTAGTKGIKVKSFTNIYLLSRTLEAEGAIDFKAADAERDELIKALEHKLSKRSLEELAFKTVQFRAEKIAPKDFYIALLGMADNAKIDMKDLPELQKYIVYISLYSAIDNAKIMEEMDALENNLKETLYRNNTERELNGLSKDLAILKNIFNISLTVEDHAYYLKNESAFNVANYLSFIDKYAPLYNITARPGEDIAELDRYREKMARFYERSLKRDEAFVRNIRFGGNAAILVTGGFHTRNLCELFKKQGISYVSILPNFKNDAGYKCPYFDLLAGKRTVFEVGLMSLASSSLAVPSVLNRLGVAANGKNAELLWRVYADLVIVVLNEFKKQDKAKSLEVRYRDRAVIVDRELNILEAPVGSSVPLDVTSVLRGRVVELPKDGERIDGGAGNNSAGVFYKQNISPEHPFGTVIKRNYDKVRATKEMINLLTISASGVFPRPVSFRNYEIEMEYIPGVRLLDVMKDAVPVPGGVDLEKAMKDLYLTLKSSLVERTGVEELVSNAVEKSRGNINEQDMSALIENIRSKPLSNDELRYPSDMNEKNIIIPSSGALRMVDVGMSVLTGTRWNLRDTWAMYYGDPEDITHKNLTAWGRWVEKINAGKKASGISGVYVQAEQVKAAQPVVARKPQEDFTAENIIKTARAARTIDDEALLQDFIMPVLDDLNESIGLDASIGDTEMGDPLLDISAEKLFFLRWLMARYDIDRVKVKDIKRIFEEAEAILGGTRAALIGDTPISAQMLQNVKPEDQVRFINDLLRKIDDSITDPGKRAQAHLAARGVLGADALAEIDPGPMNIVVQFVPLDLKPKVQGKINEAKRQMRAKNYGAGNTVSIVNSSATAAELVSEIGKLRDKMAGFMGSDPNAMMMIEVPSYLLDDASKKALEALTAENKNIIVQVIRQDEGEYPDVMTFFELGIKLIDLARTGIRTQSLLNLLAAVLEPGEKMEDVLKTLFKLDATLKIRKIDLNTLEQAEEAMALIGRSL